MNNITKRIVLTPFNLLYKVSPKTDLKLLFKIKQGYSLNLIAPETYNEKIQWLKLNDHNPLMITCCDKYTVRKYVEDQGCADILNRLLWDGFNPADIPFDKLPEKCVIKVTHGSTFNIICMDSTKLDRQATIKKCNKWLKEKYLPCYGEWFYGIEKPRIIVEEFIESADDKQLRDYKVFCFNGEPRLIRVITDRFIDHKDSIFDCEWNLIEGAYMGHRQAGRMIEKPECLNKLLDYARKLSSPFYHVRVDFYVIRDRIIFGELTFTNGAGFSKFEPRSLDYEMGKMLKLPI